MNERMTQQALGNAGDSAIKTVSAEYLQFMIEHPGVYETIQWATWHGNEETVKIFDDYRSLLTTLIHSCGFKKQAADEILNLTMGVLHGYTALQLRFALVNPNGVKTGLCNAIDTLLTGAHLKYQSDRKEIEETGNVYKHLSPLSFTSTALHPFVPTPALTRRRVLQSISVIRLCPAHTESSRPDSFPALHW